MASKVNGGGGALNAALNAAQYTIRPAWYLFKGAGSLIRGAWSSVPYKQSIEATFRENSTAAKAAAIAAATLATGGAASVVGGGLLLSSAMGLIGGGAAAMSVNPDQNVLVHIPTKAPFVLKSSGDHPDAENLKNSINILSEKPAIFKQNHPEGMFAARRLEKPPKNPEKEKKLKEEQDVTNSYRDSLVENGSIYSSLYTIFILGLGFKMRTGDDRNILMEITQKAVTPINGRKPSVWEACTICLEEHGIELTFFQKIVAKGLYFFTYSLGLIPNTIEEIAKRTLSYFRTGVKGEESLNLILKVLGNASSFLDQYIDALNSYANAGLPGYGPSKGDVAAYLKELVDQSGDKTILLKLLQEGVNQGEIGKRTIEELCKDLVKVVVDDPEIFPPIQFFKELQKLTLFGLRYGAIFDIFEWIFGAGFNWIGKKLIKAYIPDVVQAIVQKGIDQTKPGKYAFQIAVADATTEQVIALKREFDKNIPPRPLRFEKNNQLKETIEKLIKTLELTDCKGNRDCLQSTFENLKNPGESEKEVQAQLNDVITNGGQLLIHYYTKNPDAMERLFGKLFALSKSSFQIGSGPQTETDYKNAIKALKGAMDGLLSKQIRETVLTKVQGPEPQTIKMILEGKKNDRGEIIYRGLFEEQNEKAERCFQVLKGLFLAMSKKIHADWLNLPSFNVVHAADPGVLEAEAAVNAAKKDIERVRDPFLKMEAKNLLEERKIQLEIAIETSKLTKESASFNEQMSPLQPTEDLFKSLAIQQKFVEGQIALVEPMRRFNALKTPNSHLLQYLDNAMKVIGEFIEHIKSLNIDLYDPMVELAFNQTFSSIYQEVASLADQTIALQRSLKSYEKSKRLANIFTEIKEELPQEAHQQVFLDFFESKLKKIKEADESFNAFEADPERLTIPFDTLIFQYEEIANELTKKEAFYQKLDRLGTPGQLRQELLSSPRKLIHDIETLSSFDAEATWDELLSSIRAKNEQLSESNFQAVFQYYKDKQSRLISEKNQKFQEIDNWITTHTNRMTTAYDQKRILLCQELSQLQITANDLAENFAKAKLPGIHFPVYELVPTIPWAHDLIETKITKPMIATVKKLTESAYEFGTSREIFEAIVRLTMGQLVRDLRKPEEPGFIARMMR